MNMGYQNKKIAEVAEVLKPRLKTVKQPASILRAPELKALADEIKLLKLDRRPQFGKELNALKRELNNLISKLPTTNYHLPTIDVTAPFDENTSKKPELLTSEVGSKHPITSDQD